MAPLTFLLMMEWLMMAALLSMAEASASKAKKGCQEKCGNVMVPYPFGISKGCYYNEWYAIKCNKTLKPSLANLDLEVLSISLYERQVTVNAPMNLNCTHGEYTTWNSTDLGGSPYKFTNMNNVFVPVGCKGSSLSYDQGTAMLECASVCRETFYPGVNDPLSSAQGSLCKTMPPFSLRLYTVNVTQSDDSATCSYVLLIMEDALPDSSNTNMTALTHNGHYIPVRLDWTYQYLPGAPSSPSGSDSAECEIIDSPDAENYVCYCPSGTSGNPYLADGMLK